MPARRRLGRIVATDSEGRMPRAFIRCCSVTFGLASLLVGLSSSARAQSEQPPAPFPPPGRLVDIGGWRLHLYCTGEAKPSQPTVILEAGLVIFPSSGASFSRNWRPSPAFVRTI